MSNGYGVKKCDDITREVVMIRDGFRCQRCGCRDREKLHPSHCYGKKAYPSLRHDLLNILLLCNDCHNGWWHVKVHDSWIWFVNEYRDRYDYLVRKKNEYVKLNKEHYEETARELTGELVKLETPGEG